MVDFQINVNLGIPPPGGLFIVLAKQQTSNDISQVKVKQSRYRPEQAQRLPGS